MIHAIVNGVIGVVLAAVVVIYSDEVPWVFQGVLVACILVIVGREVWMDITGRVWQTVAKRK